MEAIDKNSPLPLYFQVKEDIEKKIKEEVYIEGEALPSEIALIDQYNVSRTTIRQAVEQLVNDGLLERRRGKGTFVKKREVFSWDVSELRSFNDVTQKKQFSTSTEVLSIEIVESDEIVRRIFKDKYTHFYHLERLRFVENQPSEIVTTYVPTSIASNLDKFDFSKISLFDILRETYHIDISYAEKKFTAINCSSEDAKVLNIRKNDALQLVETVTFDSSDNPIEYSIARDKGLISTFKVTFKKQDALILEDVFIEQVI